MCPMQDYMEEKRQDAWHMAMFNKVFSNLLSCRTFVRLAKTDGWNREGGWK